MPELQSAGRSEIRCLAHRILLIDRDPASKAALPLQQAVAERELASLSLSLWLPGMESPP